jgi:GTP-sensing pleiotropic transcriptional regulator CodY
MNTERLLRELEKRLAGVTEEVRAEVLDATREEIARERRRVDPTLTVEAERKRRIEAETLREVLEAINRQARLEETIDEVLKQLAKIVAFDACTLSLGEVGGRMHTLVVRGPVDLTPGVRVDIPLFVEGTMIGQLSLARLQDEPFEEEDLHWARAVAFSASAAIQKARLLEKVRRYAALMERVVAVDQAVFANLALAEVAQVILEGAVQIGKHRGGLLALRREGTALIDASVGEGLEAARGKATPRLLEPEATSRLPPAAASAAAATLGVSFPATELYLVPLATSTGRVGTLVLFDQDGATADDLLMEAYASRAAAAYLHASLAR